MHTLRQAIQYTQPRKMAMTDAIANPIVPVLANYARYHRDQRNIFSHFFGVPMIVFGVQVVLARAGVEVGGVFVSALWIATALVVAYYMRLELLMGAVMAVELVLMGMAATWLAGTSPSAWWIYGIGWFAIGWVIQFIGHYYEGKKPAFVDDLIGLAIGPLFVTVEMLFLLKMRPDLQRGIEAIAGPTHIRKF
jgi:uncharacterized membrane protein YGL010W